MTAMLELDITHMVEKDGDEMPLLSGSVAELGPNAGILTWGSSKRYAEAHPLLTTPEQIQEAKDYFKEFGAWSEEEVAGFVGRRSTGHGRAAHRCVYWRDGTLRSLRGVQESR